MLKKYLTRRMRHSLIVLFGLAVAVHFLDSRGYLHGPQMALGLDPMLQGRTPSTPVQVSLVKITDQDYKDYFCAQSPLDARAVLALVAAVQERLQPAVIGVDLDTSEWKKGAFPATCPKADKFPCTLESPKGENRADDSCLQGAIENLVHPPVKMVGTADLIKSARVAPSTIVWAQIPGEPEERTDRPTFWVRVESCWNLFWNGVREEWTALPLQTVEGKAIPPESFQSGIPRFPLDSDGVVRRYRRRYFVFNNSAKQGSREGPPPEMNSLPHALAEACQTCSRDRAWLREEEKHSNDDIIMNFVDPYLFSPIEAGYLLSATPQKSYLNTPQDEDVKEARALRQKEIVIVGGTYKGARDIYRTPFGEMPGVQLLAQAVENDLNQGISEVNEFKKFSADIFAGLLVIFLWNSKAVSRYLSLRFIFGLSLVGIFVAFTIFSHYLLRHSIWLDSIAILVGVVIHQVVEEFNKIQESKEEHQKVIEGKNCEIAGLKLRLEEFCGAVPTPGPPSAATSKSTKPDK